MISHKLAPFLSAWEDEDKRPVAGYAVCQTSVLNTDLDQDKTSKNLNQNQKQNKLTGFSSLAVSGTIEDLREHAKKHTFDLLLDIFCVDNGKDLHLFYIFENSVLANTLIFKLELQNQDHVPSLSHYYKSANWLERECFDLFGIYFENHPDLRRLILYPEFAGHPLRLNYPINKAQPLVPLYA